MVGALLLAACGGNGSSAEAPPATELASQSTSTEATGSGAEPQVPTETTTVELMMFPGQTYRLPIRIAEQQGYFEEVGIQISEVPQPGNISGVQGLEATGADAGILSISTLAQGWQGGAEVAYFCGSLPLTQTTLLASADSDLPSTEEGASWEEVVQSLSGKTIGIQTPVGSGLQLLFAAMLEEQGVTDVDYVNTGVQTQVVQAALDNGEVDVVQANPTGVQQLLLNADVKTVAYLAAEEGPVQYNGYYGSAWVGTREWLENSPELAEGFCQATEKALEFIRDDANTEEAATALVEDTGVSQEVAERAVTDYTFEDWSTEIGQGTVETTIDAYIDLGVLEESPVPTYDDIVVPSW